MFNRTLKYCSTSTKTNISDLQLQNASTKPILQEATVMNYLKQMESLFYILTMHWNKYFKYLQHHIEFFENRQTPQ